MSTNNKIFITGDCHGDIDFHKLASYSFHQGKTLTKDDYVIVCGDMGIIWDGANQDKYIQNWYSTKPWTTLFVDGNHENFDILNSYPVEIWNGGKIHRINDSLIHLMRGQVFTINSKKFFTFGGATSVDKMNRKEGISWWSQEMPTDEEYNEGLDNLEKHNNKVDYIITHCAPDGVQDYLFPYYTHDKLTNYLEIIRKTIEYKIHFMGHYHIDKDLTKWRVLYTDVVELKD